MCILCIVIGDKNSQWQIRDGRWHGRDGTEEAAEEGKQTRCNGKSRTIQSEGSSERRSMASVIGQNGRLLNTSKKRKADLSFKGRVHREKELERCLFSWTSKKEYQSK
jgi:hypothetical protein